MLKIKFLPLAFLCFSSTHAQNLIANGGFEEINICSEFYAKCAPEAWFHIPLINPVSRANLPPAFSGKLYETFVMENLEGLRNHRFFLYTRLLCPLKAGAQYKLSFYMNSLQIETFQFGALVSTIRPNMTSDSPFRQDPTLIFTQDSTVSVEAMGWRKMETVFTANGGEEYLTFGNFDPTPLTLQKKEKKRLEIKLMFDEVAMFPISNDYVYCPDMEKRRDALYAENDRHTYPGERSIVDTYTATIQPDSIDTGEYEGEYDEELSLVKTIETPPVKFIIPDIGFDFGKYALNPSANTVLETCAAQISNQRPRSVHISGYTDDVGSDAFNLELSAKRALSVKNWFVEKHGLATTLFVVQGLGESDPIATNETEAGRQANRRVEINFVK